MEMIYLYTFHGLTPAYYNAAGFYSPGIAWKKKRLYLSSKQYFKRVWKLNNPDYRKLSQNKLSEKALLTLFSIPTPQYVGFLDNKNGRSMDGRPLRTETDLEALLSSYIDRKICFKLTEGWGGKGFQAVEILSRKNSLQIRPLNEVKQFGVHEFLGEILAYPMNGPYLLEDYFEQHPVLRQINPTSVNTVRAWTISRQGKKPERVIGAFLRIGRAGSMVDNTASGGFICGINLANGVLATAEDPHNKWIKFRCHPDNGEIIAGIRIPHWDESLDLCCKTLALFPQIRFAGLDIAIGPAGPAILEMNVPPDPHGGVVFGFCTKDLVSLDPW
ncbi:MAG: sugar-transfer associated ATP-grasp domain-containing protein [Acidobacteriota bacterium]|nr:sugar-transfer associated ATP-grasp domain-containing protein [Acidobacteriota bacterium]